MKDTLLNRFRAIEAVVAMDAAFDIDCAVAFHPEKLSQKRLIELLKSADKLIVDVYHLTHGYNSKCCKGLGAKLIAPWTEAYYGKPRAPKKRIAKDPPPTE